MSEEARNVGILKEAYGLWHDTKGASVDHWMSICADQLDFGSLAQSVKSVPYMTVYESKEKLGEYFAGLSRDWEMIEYRIEHYVAERDRVVALGRCSWRARKSGVVVWTPIANSLRLAGGKIIEFYEYFDTAQVISTPRRLKTR
jgi:ketosteroid isomerase-like protein